MILAPLVYIVFNRPKHTAQSFEVIRKLRPTELFIVADGPRVNHPDDIDLCDAVRAIVGNVDWPCDVKYNYSDSNLGLKRRVTSGLDWVFNQVDRAIVLEDDCIAHPDFFNFCNELLDRYSEDERVYVITGNNFQGGRKRGGASYYFSKYNHCWGWATWKRAWRSYQEELSFWPEWKTSSDWFRLAPDKVERRYWNRIFELVIARKIDSWAFPWTASVWLKGGLTATPNVNLVTNIGFGSDSTHTLNENSSLAEIAIEPLGSIVHPQSIVQDVEADQYVFDHVFGGRLQRFPLLLLNLPCRVIRRLLKIFKKSKKYVQN